MTEKYLMLNLHDENTSRIAEIMANKTCKKMLSSLADKELSETDLSRELKIPINTIEYNLKKLLQAGLIEKTKNFFWSTRGKKIGMYRLANKKIIISTKSPLAGILSSALIFGAMGFALNIFKNIFQTSRKIYTPDLIQTSKDYIPASSLSSEVMDSSKELISSNTFDYLSLFNNTFTWIILGALIGIAGFLIYRKMKGGSNKI